MRYSRDTTYSPHFSRANSGGRLLGAAQSQSINRLNTNHRLTLPGMARLRELSSPSDGSDRPEASSSRPVRRVASHSARHPSPSSASSNQENHHASRIQPQAEKGNAGSNRPSMSSSTASNPALSHRKRKLQDMRAQPSQARHRRELEERVDKEFYDPDQDGEERRAVRKGMRELNKELNGSVYLLVPLTIFALTQARHTFRALKGRL